MGLAGGMAGDSGKNFRVRNAQLMLRDGRSQRPMQQILVGIYIFRQTHVIFLRLFLHFRQRQWLGNIMQHGRHARRLHARAVQPGQHNRRLPHTQGMQQALLRHVARLQQRFIIGLIQPVLSDIPGFFV